jgi:hypothetical protein
MFALLRCVYANIIAVDIMFHAFDPFAEFEQKKAFFFFIFNIKDLDYLKMIREILVLAISNL